jgi:(p)ppGpp synthase/HD superfamily hydrolase
MTDIKELLILAKERLELMTPEEIKAKFIEHGYDTNNNTKTPEEMLHDMLITATNAHSGQYDKSGMPYILHPLKVMHYLNTKDFELMCIALGHDLLEDTHITPIILWSMGMSERVIRGIECLTKVPGESYEEYKEKVKSNYDSVLVKLADLKHNTSIERLKGITPKDMKRTLKYYQFYLELTEIKIRVDGQHD